LFSSLLRVGLRPTLREMLRFRVLIAITLLATEHAAATISISQL
jgi:hypothetical protein